MRLTYRYRIFPTKAQRAALETTLDACRWVYNNALAVRKEAWSERQESVSKYDTINMIPEWKKRHDWLRQAYAQVLQESCRRVDLAFQNFFRRAKTGEKEVGYPRFKGKGWYDSFTFPQFDYGWRIEGDTLRVFNVGNIRIKLHRPTEGNVKSLTLRRDTLGNWYACLSCEVEWIAPEPSPYVVGVDMGLRTFATLSTGAMVDNPRFFWKDENALARAKRKVGKCQKGTQEYEKAKQTVFHIHARIANRRKDFAHKLSRYLANVFQVIVFEDLNIDHMIQNPHFSKSIKDAAWGRLIRYATYKAESAGRSVVLVNPAYTSQDCSSCGNRKKKTLSERTHRCPKCGLEIDRDLNAALNILARGLASIGENP